MQVKDFVSEVARTEGKKKETTVGNIREVLAIANRKLGGELYKLIKKLPKDGRVA